MNTSPTLARLGVLAAASVVLSSSVLAATYSWQAAGTTNTWSTAPSDTNWFIDAGETLSPWADANDAVLAGATGGNIALSGTVEPASTTVNDNANWMLSGTGILGGTGTLAKNGTGILELTTSNSYTAGTTVSAGTLLVNNGATGSATGSGAVSVATGATLGGSGGATGSVTAAGTLSPGSSAAPFGVLRTGATTLTGTYACQIDGLSTDVLAVSGNIDLSGGTLTLSATGAGATETSYIIATWTGTRTSDFSEVSGLPSGYEVVYDDLLREVRLKPVVTDGYLIWEASNGITGAGEGTDSDGDGIPNGIEFVIGGDPSGPGSSSAVLLPKLTVDATHLNFEFRRTDDSAYLDPFVEYGTTLGIWTEAEAGVDGVVVNEDNDFYGSGTDRVTFVIPRDLAAPGSNFFTRLRVEVP